ncbi:MAG: hypothetical protein U5L06_11380 [Rhodovibrio sp.]|nr:hypothetical protein [Rhodovibrio sp.]
MRLAATILIAFAALWIAASEYLHLRWTDPDEPVEAIRSMQFSQPWGGLAAKEAGRFLETRWRLDAEAAEAALRWQLGRYPLSAARWLLAARIANTRGAGEAELTDLLATAIAVRPNSADLRWQAANLAQTTGRAGLVFRQLRLLLEIDPRATDRALFVGSRWAEGPDTLLDEILPPGEEYLEQAMRRARRSGSMPLAEAVWTRLNDHVDGAVEPDHPAFSDYIYLALRHDPTRAMAAWQTVDPDYHPGDLPAGDLAYPLEVLPSFGWSLRMPAGATAQRIELPAGRGRTPDAQDTSCPRGQDGCKTSESTPKALRITFSGEHNLRLNTHLVGFPAAGPGAYRLRGWWRAKGLTTRSLPYLWLDTRSEDHRTRERVDVPSTEFGWRPFEIEYEVHNRAQRVNFRLRRDSTDAFDRYIDGEIMLAGLGVERLLPSTDPAPLPSAWRRVRDRVAGDCRTGGGDDEESDSCGNTTAP